MDPNQPANQDSGKACGFSGPLQLGLTSSQPQPTSNDPPSQLSGPRSVEPGEPLTQSQISTEALQAHSTQVENKILHGRVVISLNINSGILEQPLILTKNYFPVLNNTNWKMYKYILDFNPPQDNRTIEKELLYAHKEVFAPYFYSDEGFLISKKKYKFEKLELTSKGEFYEKKLIISVKLLGMVEPDEYICIEYLEYVLRICHWKVKKELRNYLCPRNKRGVPKHRIKLWPGYEMLIVFFDKRLLFMVDIPTKMLRQDTVLDLFRECFSNEANQKSKMNKFKMKVIGAEVLTIYNNKTYIVDDVTCDLSINSTFSKEWKSEITYNEYYKAKWSLDILEGNQPLLVLNIKKYKRCLEYDVAYLIPEFCILTGFTESMKKEK